MAEFCYFAALFFGYIFFSTGNNTFSVLRRDNTVLVETLGFIETRFKRKKDTSLVNRVREASCKDCLQLFGIFKTFIGLRSRI